MRFAYQILIHTPLWAFLLLAYLVWQGIKAMRPRTVTVQRSLIMPAISARLNIPAEHSSKVPLSSVLLVSAIAAASATSR